MSRVVFRLKVQQVEQVCFFELSWGQGQQLEAQMPYPPTLRTSYQEWQRVYLSFYNTALRGRTIAAGSLPEPPINWHEKLVQAEAQLLHEFHTWLRRGELYEIRDVIEKRGKHSSTVELFLTCSSLELERLPWENWEIAKAFKQFRLFRRPRNIHEAAAKTSPHSRGKARILAILGDDTGLNFQKEEEALNSLPYLEKPKIIGWEPGKNTEELKTEIVQALQAKPGWDILFFAGHSNETNLTGGEIAIAPNVTLSLSEIEQPLKTAKENGLKFAIFNSCKGLSIAHTLIGLGLNQVAIMREPIHNQVAQEFLVQFIHHLGELKDVGEALQATCQYLQHQLHLKYPSAYLVPSLFCHPKAPLFRLQPYGIKQRLKRWLPTRIEAVAISALALLSWSLFVQGFLLERRVFIQAVYRQLTHQIPPNTKPPLLIVEIDDQSIIEGKIKDPTPMERPYLSRLVNKASALNAKVIGIDYLLDRPHGKSDIILAQSIQKAVQKHQIWFVFAAYEIDTEKWVSALPEIASLKWSLQGDMKFHDKLIYMKLVPLKDSSSRNLPFSYLLALAHRLTNCNDKPHPPTPFPRREGGVIYGSIPILQKYWAVQASCSLVGVCEQDAHTTNLQKRDVPVIHSTPLSLQERGWGRGQNECRIPQPHLRSPTDFLSQLLSYLNKNNQDYTTLFSPQSHPNPITYFAYGWGNMWLHPIIDFSIPPQQIYQRIPAWEFLKLPTNSPQFKQINQQVLMIAPGAYGDDPGGSVGQADVFALPLAVSYWREQQNVSTSRRFLTGGEGHAYIMHNLLTQRLVVPIPDIWMIGIAAVLGKGIAIVLVQRQILKGRQLIIVLAIGTAIYGLVSLQTYISGAIILPWFLPSLTLWTYVLLTKLRRK